MLTAGPLTVKHVEEGHESMCQALSVTFDRSPTQYQTGPVYPEVTAWGVCAGVTDDTYTRYSSGLVYVMNEAGATVAKYDLTSRSDAPTAGQQARAAA